MSTDERDSQGRFLPGVTPNPGGLTKTARLVRERLNAEAENIVRVLLIKLELGDDSALREALARICPPLKSTTDGVELPGLAEAKTIPEKVDAILAATGNGTLDIDRAAKLIGALAQAAQLVELEDLKRRLAELESK